jgi:hypothetical protein
MILSGAYQTQADRALVPVFTEFVHLTGIPRPPLNSELLAAHKLMALQALALEDVVRFAQEFSRGAVVRSGLKQNLYEGEYDAPAGGAGVLKEADKLVRLASRPNERITPWHVHVRWMALLPLTEGNLIAGLGIWCWMHRRISGVVPSEFFRKFYRETVGENR